jgi:CBS domain-containing protein
MLVRNVMKTEVLTVKKNTPYTELVSFLIKKRISGVPVVDSHKKVVGIISEKDLLYQLFPSQEEFYQDLSYYMDQEIEEKDAIKVKRLVAADFMTKKVISVKPNDHILTACSLLITNNIRRLPVIEKGKLVGIVTSSSLYKDFLKKLCQKHLK